MADFEIRKEEILVFRVIEYGMKHTAFRLVDLYSDLNISGDAARYVFQTLTSHSRTTSHTNKILVLFQKVQGEKAISNKNYFALLPDAVTKYLDLLEIQEARKASSDANRNAMMAIRISAWAIVVSVLSVIVALAQLLIATIK